MLGDRRRRKPLPRVSDQGPSDEEVWEAAKPRKGQAPERRFPRAVEDDPIVPMAVTRRIPQKLYVLWGVGIIFGTVSFIMGIAGLFDPERAAMGPLLTGAALLLVFAGLPLWLWRRERDDQIRRAEADAKRKARRRQRHQARASQGDADASPR